MQFRNRFLQLCKGCSINQAIRADISRLLEVSDRHEICKDRVGRDRTGIHSKLFEVALDVANTRQMAFDCRSEIITSTCDFGFISRISKSMRNDPNG